MSLTQPWAWLVVHGGKDIENRKWNTKLRGEFLIHAAKGMTDRNWWEAFEFTRGIGFTELADLIPQPSKLPRGGIIGVAELVEVWEPTSNSRNRWHMPEQFGFQLRGVRHLPFLACKGALGFWGNFEIRNGEAVRL